ncbi:MAG: ECF transporter S component [Lactobacillales bacterium]|nr:ECF transporter S component [Lactobacillales bacterium]
MKSNLKSRRLVYLGIWSALTIALGMYVKIQTPVGIFTPMCDVGVFLAAFLFGARGGFVVGARGGFVVGATSGFLIDLFSGAPEWMFFSFMIHGFQGFVTGKVAEVNTGLVNKKELSLGWRIMSLIIGGFVMVVGYACAGSLLYGWRASIVQVPSNIVQTGVGIAVTLVMEVAIKPLRKLSLC